MNELITKWNLGQLGKIAVEEELASYRQAGEAFFSKWKKDKSYLKDSRKLREALDEWEAFASRWAGGGKTGYSYWLQQELDQSNPAIKAMNTKIDDVVKQMLNKLRFFNHNLAKIPGAQQKIFLAAAPLAKYHHYLEQLFAESKYLLSEAEENILTLKDKPARENWVSMTNELLSKETREGKTIEVLLSDMRSHKKPERDRAAELFNEILAKYEEVAEIELNSVLEDKKVNDNLRKAPRPETMRLLADDIEPGVVDSLTAVVSRHNEIPQQFYQLKAQLFKLPKLQYHERNLSYGDNQQRYSFEKGVELVTQTFQGLDPEFSQIFDGFISQGLVDVYPKPGKANGAFCAGFTRLYPTYILLNWTDSSRDVTTLAHEAGHGINNELMKREQNGLTWGTPTSTAEVASTFFEDFVNQRLAQGADEETKLTMLMNKIDNDIQSIWRQVACFQFEQDLHKNYRQKGYLSKKEIGEWFQKRMAAYMGPAVEQSPGSQNWWIYWGHIRRYFYVYSYASGQLISKSLQNSVRQDKAFVKKVKAFLAAGTSESPKNIFAKTGIDIEASAFWEKGVEEVKRELSEAVTLARKLGKIENKG
ncbi:M3 family oligoendopeptidase [Patescibacteria group bacterium]|nr:M3 family oligoendopeptidase [Patescibacteria group bacterium]